MVTVEKPKHKYFYILNVKLRRRDSNKDLLPSDYVRIFKKAYADKIHKESSPNKHCIFKFMFEEKEKNEVIFLSGTFAQFTYIQNDRWFNLNTLDLDAEFNIPDGLFPDTVITDFVFIPAAHRFCFRTASDIKMSPYPIRKFLESALNEACKENEFVQVDVESDKSSIDNILSAQEVRKLFIDINYSNYDIGNDLKAFVEEDIKASNSSRLKVEATQKPGVSIDIKKSKILTGALEASVSDS